MLKHIFELLTPKERIRAVYLIILMLLMALLDMLGVASILPFIAVLANPEIVNSHQILNAAFVAGNSLGVNTINHFLFAIGMCVFILLVVSLVLKAFVTYAQTRFALMCEHSISQRLFEAYMQQSYCWFLGKNSADLGKIIVSEVGAAVNGGILQLLTVVSQGAVTFALLALIIVVDPFLAFSVGIVLTSLYVVVFVTVGGWLKRLGILRVQANNERFRALTEAFGAIKVIKAAGLEQIFTLRFGQPSLAYAKHESTARVIAQLPRFALEIIAFGGMLMVILYLMTTSGDFVTALPMVSLYAFAGYRLMPALQQIYASLAQLRFSGPSIEAVRNDLINLPVRHTVTPLKSSLSFKESIVLKGVSYRYPGTLKMALKSVDITIAANSTVGFVGTTGSGKTTMVDLILGLLPPHEGSLSVDGKVITDANKFEWQKLIGYVPQNIYLADDSLAANIAFGVREKEIDWQCLNRAAKLANLHDFVTRELPQGYSTKVGERGVRLSGGQRQRIGIARALYHNPKLLILDEATSALDNVTERAVVDAIKSIGGEITIIHVAHRLSTVRQCDQIFLLEKGELAAHGTFETLTNQNPRFRAMTEPHQP